MRFIGLSWITTGPGRAWVGSVTNKHNPSTESGLSSCISSRITTVIHVRSDHQVNYNCFNEPFAVSPYRGLYWDMHGLIFETSIWLLAGSTRFVSDHQSQGETEQPNQIINDYSNTVSLPPWKLTAAIEHLVIDTELVTQRLQHKQATRLKRPPANECNCWHLKVIMSYTQRNCYHLGHLLTKTTNFAYNITQQLAFRTNYVEHQFRLFAKMPLNIPIFKT